MVSAGRAQHAPDQSGTCSHRCVVNHRFGKVRFWIKININEYAGAGNISAFCKCGAGIKNEQHKEGADKLYAHMVTFNYPLGGFNRTATIIASSRREALPRFRGHPFRCH